MQVKLRLQRFGSKKRPFYRIVAASNHEKRDGKFLEIVGLYHPLVKEDQQTRLNEERIKEWLKDGAEPSETVRAILSKAGIWKTHMAAKMQLKREKKAKKKQSKAETAA